MSSRYLFLRFVFLSIHIIAQVTGSVNFAYERGLKWCDNFCLCPENSEDALYCFVNLDIYHSLNYPDMKVHRLQNHGYDPITTLKWCDNGNCLCNKLTDKSFDCIKNYTQIYNTIDEVSKVYRDQSVQVAGVFPHIVENQTERDQEKNFLDPSHTKRDMEEEERRNRRRQNRRNNRRERKRNRNDSFRHGGDNNIITEDNMNYDTFGDDSDVFADYPEINMLPKQEAINSNPMVTAMSPPTRRQQVTPPAPRPSTLAPPLHHEEVISSSRPNLQESVHVDFQPPSTNTKSTNGNPITEVPVQRKTVAGRVSQDLQQITEGVMEIRSDVLFNQRILLVTAGIAGVAMLGVLVLALHACCSKKSNRHGRIAENGRHDDGRHPSSTVTKVNIDEAW